MINDYLFDEGINNLNYSNHSGYISFLLSTTTNHSVVDNQGNCLYFPYAICIWSSVSKIESFKLLMFEMYKIISYQNTNYTEDFIRDFRYAELLHFFLFTSTVIKPPSYSRLSLNFRKHC
jgi:hypothetical protein